MKKIAIMVVLALAVFVTCGCASGGSYASKNERRESTGQATQGDQREDADAVALDAGRARLRPITRPREADEDPEIKIRRQSAQFCAVEAEGGVWYIQQGVVRPITAPFPCPLCWCACLSSRCDGTNNIVVVFEDGTRVSEPEVW